LDKEDERKRRDETKQRNKTYFNFFECDTTHYHPQSSYRESGWFLPLYTCKWWCVIDHRELISTITLANDLPNLFILTETEKQRD
jgi:hypothetical protein